MELQEALPRIYLLEYKRFDGKSSAGWEDNFIGSRLYQQVKGNNSNCGIIHLCMIGVFNGCTRHDLLAHGRFIKLHNTIQRNLSLEIECEYICYLKIQLHQIRKIKKKRFFLEGIFQNIPNPNPKKKKENAKAKKKKQALHIFLFQMPRLIRNYPKKKNYRTYGPFSAEKSNCWP
jgi:hypothetical protein